MDDGYNQYTFVNLVGDSRGNDSQTWFVHDERGKRTGKNVFFFLVGTNTESSARFVSKAPPKQVGYIDEWIMSVVYGQCAMCTSGRRRE